MHSHKFYPKIFKFSKKVHERNASTPIYQTSPGFLVLRDLGVSFRLTFSNFHYRLIVHRSTQITEINKKICHGLFILYSQRNLVSYRRRSFHVIPLRHVFAVRGCIQVWVTYTFYFGNNLLLSFITLSINQQLIFCFEGVEEMAS